MHSYYLRLFERKGLFGMLTKLIDSFPVNSNDGHVPAQGEQIRVIREADSPEEFYIVKNILNHAFQSYSLKGGNAQHSRYNSREPEVFAVRARRAFIKIGCKNLVRNVYQ